VDTITTITTTTTTTTTDYYYHLLLPSSSPPPSPLLILPNGQVIPLRPQQVTNLLVVDLEVGGSDKEAHTGGSVLLYMSEYLLYSAGDDATIGEGGREGGKGGREEVGGV